jgi:hypothetical protein
LAMKESYHQRSFMLRELNASANAKLYNLGLERGAGGAGRHIAERSREDISRTREERGVFDRRGSASQQPVVARHRSRDQGD